jgi:hypothetical protein
MKKIILASIALVFIASYVKADSPITSTDIYKAYTDVDMVKYAKKHPNLDKKIAEYLHSTDVSIDVKAAVINAVGWSVDGKTNAEDYCKYIYSSLPKDIDINSLSADELLCIGYLIVLDDYFHPKYAIPYLTKAKELNKTSFTVAIIDALIHAQDIMDDQGSWCDMWDVVHKVYDDKSVYNDLRDKARKIIWDYMIEYKCDKNK